MKQALMAVLESRERQEFFGELAPFVVLLRLGQCLETKVQRLGEDGRFAEAPRIAHRFAGKGAPPLGIAGIQKGLGMKRAQQRASSIALG